MIGEEGKFSDAALSYYTRDTGMITMCASYFFFLLLKERLYKNGPVVGKRLPRRRAVRWRDNDAVEIPIIKKLLLIQLFSERSIIALNGG